MHPRAPRDPDARRRRARRGRTAAGAVAVLALAVLPATAATAAAAAPGTADPPPGTDPVEAALARPEALDTLAEVAALADDTGHHAGPAVGVVVDANGDRPGGIRTERVVAAPEDLAALADRLEQVPGVFAAAPAVPVTALGDPLVPQQYGPRTVGADGLDPTADGRGTTVAVVDSGVTAGHPDLVAPLPDGRPRVLAGRTFLGGDPADGTPATTDPNGHGTHVAGIVAAARDGVGGTGVAPGAQVLPVRVLGAGGSGTSTDLAAGILWAHQQGADVVNLSLGAQGPLPGDVAAVITHVTTDTGRGRPPTVVVASAGNYGVGSASVWPASHDRVVAVAATDAADAVAPYSSRGAYVDVAAPGSGILSTCRTGGWCTMSGTSMAAPLTAGAVAVLRGRDPTLGPDAALAVLQSTAVDVDVPGPDVASGRGRIDLLAAAGAPAGATPAAPAAPAPTRLTGGLDAVVVDRRTIGVAGWVAEPDGAAVVRVLDVHRGRWGVTDLGAPGGRFLHGWSVSPGTHDVCAVGLDAPTGESVLLGCRQVVVK